jgi:hypothetical protein
MGHGSILDATSIMGAIAVLAGFILVNIGEETKEGCDDDEEEEDSTTNTNRDSDVTISPPTCCLESEMKRTAASRQRAAIPRWAAA